MSIRGVYVETIFRMQHKEVASRPRNNFNFHLPVAIASSPHQSDLFVATARLRRRHNGCAAKSICTTGSKTPIIPAQR